MKGWKKFTKSMATKKAGVAILISDKVDFKPTLIKQDKEGHFILIKGEIDQKEIIIINPYAPNVNATNFIKHTLKDLKAYINTNTVVVGDFNTPLSSIDRSLEQKINTEIQDLKYTIDQMTYLMSTEHFIQLLQNIHSSQQPIEPLQNRSYPRAQSKPQQI
jgi:exonuclease III